MKKLNSSLTNVRFITLSLAIFLLFAMPAAALADNYYVKTSANGGNDANTGSDWNNAKATITAAMGLAATGDNIHVAAGIYAGTVNFPSASYIQLFGGYPAAGGGTQAPWTNTTVIQGGGPVVSIPYNSAGGGQKSYVGLVIDGFTIKNGSNSSPYSAGIQSFSAGLTIKRCIVENNSGTGSVYAGGIYVLSMINDGSSVIFKLQESIIRNNTGTYSGGLFFDSIGYPQFQMINCLIYGNSATDTSGIYSVGGVAIGSGSQTIGPSSITNCTIADNTSANSSVPVGGIVINTESWTSAINIKNSILWHSSLDDVYAYGGSALSISYSDIHDNDTGTGVIHTDPAFAGSGDYHLTSGSGDCIDGGTSSGAPSTDLEGTARVGYDMGAYEYEVPPAPDITVTDDKGATNDLQVPFGEVTVGESADATVTITNDGTQDLNIGTITDPATPFSINAAACSGQLLAPSESCDCTVTFTPAETGPFNSSFSIPSDDPDENPVTVSVSGTGISPVVQYTLTTDVDPDGSGTIILNPPGGIYNEGSSVALTATAGDGYMFDGWNGEVDDPDTALTTTIMNADKTVTAMFMADDDNDGVPTEEEQGPGGTDAAYDGDGSGTPDSMEDNVASGHTYDGAYYVTLAVPATQSLADVETSDNPSSSDTPDGVSFPYGFFDFTITGVTPGDDATITIYLPAGEEPTTYWKYGPTPTDNTDHWYEFLYDGTTGAEFNGNVITLHFVDGDRGDDDLTANGIISDAGAPGEPATADSGSSSCFISTLNR